MSDSVMTEPEITMPPYEPPVADRAFYNGLSKLSWSFAICWVIFTCVKGMYISRKNKDNNIHKQISLQIQIQINI